jgi:CHAT domain-containing protein
VDDAPTAALKADLDAGLERGEPVAGALRAAQLARIEAGEPPRHWAPFVLIGRSRCALLAHAISPRVA